MNFRNVVLLVVINIVVTYIGMLNYQVIDKPVDFQKKSTINEYPSYSSSTEEYQDSANIESDIKENPSVISNSAENIVENDTVANNPKQDTMIAVSERISNIVKSCNDLPIETRQAYMQRELENLESEGLIQNVSYDESHLLFMFQYKDGTEGGLQVESFSPLHN